MLKGKLDGLKEHILQYNPYFNNAFADVIQDDTTGIVHNGKPIFPNDTLGDYFYLRLPSNVQFEYAPIYNISTSINGVGLRSNIVLVACMRNADPDKLLSNLVNTIQSYQTEYVRFTGAIYESDGVLLQELSKIKDKENIEAALQRLGNDYTLVSIIFQYTFPFTFQKPICITEPCKTC